MKLTNYRIFIITLILVALLIAGKYLLHLLNLEFIALGSLHTGAVSGVIFVIGFLLSATIVDYKEAERIPAEAAATIEDMHEDTLAIAQNYPKFDLRGYQVQLRKVAEAFTSDLRNSQSSKARRQIHQLNVLNIEMERAGVPPNFIVKLKQQQAQLVRHMFRVHYIQRITFVPSATVLTWSIVILAIALLMFTEVEPFTAGVFLTGAITFVLLYVLQLIQVIKTPFHSKGKTRDDVSLFLLEDTIEHLRSRHTK